MNVKVKDRKDHIEFVRMALNLAEIGVDYPNADLIIRIMERLNKLKGKFSLKDGIEILHDWKREWAKYAENELEVKAAREPQDE